jgi:eukaryotic-like serine/threonine-protein kinase
VFALGIVMWELLIGRYLFRRDTEFLTFQAITAEPIDDVATLRPDVPRALADVIRTALSRDREARFPTARMLGEAIFAAIPPFTGSAISEDIARSFPRELGEQAALIRAAREGGAFDLDVERGPSSDIGTAMLTTPTSQRHAFAARPLVDHSVQRVPLPASQPTPAPASQTGPAPGSQITPAPHAGGLRWRPLIIAAIALLLGAAGAYIYALISRPAPVGAPAAGSDVAVMPQDATLVADSPSASATVAATGAGDAAPGGPPAAAPIDAAVPDAATEPASTDPRPARPRNGFITIDSAPVYSTIYINGRNYGETPLVNLPLPPGRYLVRAVAPTGVIREQRIVIEPGKTAPTMRLQWP